MRRPRSEAAESGECVCLNCEKKNGGFYQVYYSKPEFRLTKTCLRFFSPPANPENLQKSIVKQYFGVKVNSSWPVV